MKISIIGNAGAGKLDFANWIANKNGKPKVPRGVFDKTVLEIEKTVNDIECHVEIAISNPEGLLERKSSFRFSDVDIIVLMIPLNDTKDVYDYWEFFTQICVNKREGRVVLVGSKADLRATEKCVAKEIGIKEILEKSIKRDSLYEFLAEDKYFYYETSSKTGEGIEEVIGEIIRIHRATKKS